MVATSRRHLHRATAAALSLLLALLTVRLTAAHSQHSAAQISTAAHRRSAPSTSESFGDAQQLEMQTRRGELLPGEEAEGIVTGIAGPEAQAEFAASEALRASDGGRRTLLHGNRRPRDYSRCPRCTLVSCVTGTNKCSGHCRTDRALYICSTNARVAPPCPEPGSVTYPDPRTLAPDALPEDRYGNALVETTAPFVGCANITGMPDGCPDPGTTGTLTGRGRVEVVTSWCVQHLYELDCFAGRGSPFYPFGYCQCLMKDEAGAVFGGPCRTSYLDWSGPDRGPDELPVRVTTEDGQTHTRFSVKDDLDLFILSVDNTFPSAEGPITSRLTVFEADLVPGSEFEQEALLPEADAATASPEGDTQGDAGDEVMEEASDEASGGSTEGAEEEEEEEEEDDESPLGKFLRDFKSS